MITLIGVFRLIRMKETQAMNPLTEFKKIPILPGLNVPALVAVAADGHPDYVLQNFNTHQTAIWYLNNNLFTHGAYRPTLPPGWNLVAPYAGGPGPWDYSNCDRKIAQVEG